MQYKVRILDMPEDERPRERLVKCGPAALSNAELLAIILRVGTPQENAINLASRLLKYYNLKQLSQLNFAVLRAIYGINMAKACAIVACFELARRLEIFTEEPNPQIKSSHDVYALVSPKLNVLKKEAFVALYLDTKNHLIREETISLGSLNASVVHPREVFKTAIQESAASLILTHNHPSGDPAPSQDDINLTIDMVKAGKLVGIEVLDHVIIGNSSFVSLKEKGILQQL